MQFLSYNIIGKKGEGTFSQVLKAQHIKNNKLVAIKCMKNVFKDIEQVNRLREIQALRRLSPHANIIQLLEVLYDKATGKLALVFELMDMNMYELIGSRETYLAEDKIKKYMYQLMKSMEHMHRNGIFHRDIKPENLLIMDECLKLADFGSCRGIYSKQPYTEYISTRWYRAPECLLTDGYYNHKMDIWGVGCVFFEVIALYPLFPGQDEIDQIHKIHNVLGTPSEKMLSKFRKHASAHMDFNFPKKKGTGLRKLLPKASPECLDLLEKMLAYNPDDRITSRQALRHPYFKELRESERKLASRKRSVTSNHSSSRSSTADGGTGGVNSPSAHPSPGGANVPSGAVSSQSSHSRNTQFDSSLSSTNHSTATNEQSYHGNLPALGKKDGHKTKNAYSHHHHNGTGSSSHKSSLKQKTKKTSLRHSTFPIKTDASSKAGGSLSSSNHVSLPSVYSKSTTNSNSMNLKKSHKRTKKRKNGQSTYKQYGAHRSGNRGTGGF
uniref:Protein kinase domain-containing protein n=1 Tax=Percolomonas cosmopolitus TaxID=63605 RepID=A0A7S1KT74_9EUKA|mmetsp:Transcript_765/g.2563  ORF Transcript_765/g.2563 Transcript_765/m.2563 type:complete len:496 (+) Transcript_765:483-1970(+)|eukprot:CAMPEP_0117442350 /NCGR_PEP_ID=MMETSP0759-20121206/4104_1 /TAXON_ID=63605 /ORGANISM="Percolomonas cosmopolitus, Strain WS" /LENGTH=495 /DNA_ID=CAMNT_0005234231 /DNA_START=485 /DNA_END=1972 /DNA_ORIENTATION=-